MIKRLFILAQPRSGSSWLMETLNSHQDITISSELYNHVLFEEAKQFLGIGRDNFGQCLEYLEKELKKNHNRFTGCKILWNQLEMISSDFSEYFLDHYRDSHFIFLYRENIFNAQVSLRIAHEYNIWHVKKKKDIKKRKIHLNLPTLFENLEKSRNDREKILNQLKNFCKKKITLNYEELFATPRKKIKDICQFLSISSRHINYSHEKKGNPFKTEEVVENYSEVKQFLKPYPHYHKMLGR